MQDQIRSAVLQATRSSDRRYDGIKADAADLTSRLIHLVVREEARFVRLRVRLVDCGAILPVTGDSVRRAADVELPLDETASKSGYGRFHAAIFGCVLADLDARPCSGAIFLTTDATFRKHPAVVAEAAAAGLKLLPGFTHVPVPSHTS